VQYKAYFPSLEELYMNGNKLHATVSTLPEYFSQMPNLLILDLSSNQFIHLPADMLKGLKLLKKLFLNNNFLSQITFGLNLFSLQYFGLSNNQIGYITKEYISLFQSMPNTTLNLLGNPFDCSCFSHLSASDILSFIFWVNSSTTQMAHSSKYKCAQSGQYLIDIDVIDFEESCLRSIQNKVVGTDKHSITFITVILVASILAALVSAIFMIIVYNNKYKLKRYYYIMLNKRNKNPVFVECENVFDIYVAYSSADYNWVTTELFPHEEEWGIKMCFKDKDFKGGVPFDEAIVEAVEKCRKTLLVITYSFVEDEICYFTLQMALCKGLDHLVIVLLEDIDMGHPQCKVLSKLIDRLPYVQYTQRDERRFWRRLRQNLD
jgi:hypothetical protein